MYKQVEYIVRNISEVNYNVALVFLLGKELGNIALTDSACPVNEKRYEPIIARRSRKSKFRYQDFARKSRFIMSKIARKGKYTRRLLESIRDSIVIHQYGLAILPIRLSPQQLIQQP